MPSPMNESTFEAILNPLVSGPARVLAKDCPVPKKAGVYAWYFRKVPLGVPTEGCHRGKGLPCFTWEFHPASPQSVASS